MALAVADAYVRGRQQGRPGVLRVRVAGAFWLCSEIHDDTNPYGECVMRRNRRERVWVRS